MGLMIGRLQPDDLSESCGPGDVNVGFSRDGSHLWAEFQQALG